MKSSLAMVMISLLISGSQADQVSKAVLIQENLVPSTGLFKDASGTSIALCAFLCVQDARCWRFAFRKDKCKLYEYVDSVSNSEFRLADGCMTYNVGGKRFQLIKQNYYYNEADAGCKTQVGGRLAMPMTRDTAILLEELQRTLDFKSCDNGMMIGLRSKGRSGIFEWENGETIDVVKGTGFQLWQPGLEPSLYKTEDVFVVARNCDKYGYWMEKPITEYKFMFCEIF